MSKRKIKDLGTALAKQLTEYGIGNYYTLKFEENIEIELHRKGKDKYPPSVGPHFLMREPIKIYGLPKIYKYIQERNLIDDFTFKLEEMLLDML